MISELNEFPSQSFRNDFTTETESTKVFLGMPEDARFSAVRPSRGASSPLRILVLSVSPW
jgi:hypothetical protein